VADVKEAASSPSEEQTLSPADLSKGFQDAVKKGFEAAQSSETTSTEKSATSEEDGEDSGKEEKPKQEAEKGPIPYERFVEVNSAKQKLEEQLEEQKSFVEAQRSIGDYCLKHNISNDDFSYWLNVAAVMKSNPEKALELLQPHIQQLQEFKGEVLSPELQEAVDSGEVTLAWAKKMAASENKTRFSQNQSKLSQDQIAQREQQRYMQEVQTSFHSWTKTKSGGDPDFQPKASPEAEDGKFEFFLNKMNADYGSAGIKNTQDLLAFADKTYALVNKSIGKFIPQKNGHKVVRTNQSTMAEVKEPKSFNEAMARGFKKAGVNFTPK
jgi:hypothetical protein